MSEVKPVVVKRSPDEWRVIVSRFERGGQGCREFCMAEALAYACEREAGLQVFLDDPDLSVGTNHLEHGPRPIPNGRRNWLFAWTDLGARRVDVIQSLLVTRKLRGVDPHTYLVDVPRRVGQHPAKQFIDLTPRIRKAKFAERPLLSDLERSRNPPTL